MTHVSLLANIQMLNVPNCAIIDFKTIHTYVINGNYVGTIIKDMSNEDPFALEGYYNEIRTYPIRLYYFLPVNPLGMKIISSIKIQ